MTAEQSGRSRWPAALASLSLQQFRWLFAGNVAFFFVVQGQMVTRVFLAWELTHRESAVALISLAVAVPMLLASTISGAVADRLDRRQIILIGQGAILASEVYVLVLLYADALEFRHLLYVSFIAGCTFPFIMPARMAIIYDIVGPRFFGNAVALAGSVVNLSRVAGPAVMGIVLDVFDVQAAYLLAVVLHVVGILCVLCIRATQLPKSSGKPLFEDVVEGFRYVFTYKALSLCILFGLLPMILAMPVQNLYVAFADEVWQVGERGFGIMVAASGVGGLLGSLWVAGRGERSNRVKLMVGSAMAFGVLLLLFSQSPTFILAIVALVFAHVFASATQVLNHTFSLQMADDRMRGRVSGLMGMSFGLTPLGVLPLAFAAEQWSISIAVAGACVVMIVLVAGFYVLSPVLRNLDKHLAVKVDAAKESSSSADLRQESAR